MKLSSDQIAHLISNFLTGKLSDSERASLNRWLKDPFNEMQFYKIIDAKSFVNKTHQYRRFNSSKAYQKVVRKHRPSKSALAYAVAIFIPLILGVSIWIISEREHENLQFSENIGSVSKKAIVTLSDGSSVDLSNDEINLVVEDGVVVGKDSSSTLVYNNIETDELQYNTISVPYGGEYHLILNDGTQVWLNSGSILKFPVNFIGKKREVSLLGEAYFEVAHNAKKPFVVNASLSSVKVYGTSFNVMSYGDDKLDQITLVEGSVGVNIGSKQIVIKPGQQAEIVHDNSRLTVKEVDVSYITGWKDGVMKFKDMSLKELSERISRWYDVDFFFANSKVSEFTFSGNFKRGTNFELLMEILERTSNIDISVEGRIVLIKETE